MFSKLRPTFTANIPDSVQREQATQILRFILRAVIVAAVVGLGPLLILDPEDFWLNLGMMLLISLYAIALLQLLKRGHTRLASHLFLALVLALTTVNVYLFGGIHTINSSGFFILVIIAPFLLRSRRALLYIGLSILDILLLYYLERTGLLTASASPPSLGDLVLLLTIFSLSAFVAYAGVRFLNQAYGLLRENEQTLQEAVAQAGRRNRELALLNRVIAVAASELEPRQVLKVTCRELAEAFPVAESAAVAALLDEEEESLTVAANYYTSDGPDLVGATFPVIDDQGSNEQIFDRREALLIDDVQSDPRLAHVSDLIEHSGIAFVLVLPLFADDENLGLIALAAEQPYPFSEEEIALAANATAAAGQVLQKARLMALTREQAQQLARLNEEARRQAQKMQQIVDNVDVGLLVLDEMQEILLANPLAKEYLDALTASKGERLDSLGGRPVEELLAPPPQNAFFHELEVETPQRRLFEVKAHRLRGIGDQRQWLLMIRDSTEEREQQAYLQLQERLGAVGQLAAGLAHDFNNKLAVITLYSEALLQQDLGEKNEKRLEAIRRQAADATDLVQQTLDFSRKALMERRRFNLLPFLKESSLLFERTLPETVTISLRHEGPEFMVEADPGRLQQALLNLALNARDAMPEGGDLRLGLRRLEVKGGAPLPDMDEGAWIEIEVADTGTGIPPEQLDHIFDPFFTTKSPDKGSGLGLAQVYGIIRQHGGYIDVVSEMGEGTTFTIYLPAVEIEDDAAASVNGSKARRNGKETILLVEDNAPLREAISDSARALNYRVLTAENGVEALNLYTQHREEIALVISDMVMPEMGGKALMHALREQRADVKMILFSGYPLAPGDKSFLEASGIRWLQKPFTAGELSSLIAEALGD
ncbi:MAG: ATP-binding protein [Candidatus Promineifilaceae bacterium]|nr:ATP-binding protein [Candidatus Promineifilaceae bacterium]